MLVGQQVGPFAVEKELGAGAMGAVYLARYTKTGLKVALKIIATGLDADPQTVARFEREMAILKKLNQPNIVRYYGGGRINGKPFYAMEFIQGESLEAVMQRRGRFTWEEVVALGQQVCAALQHAHELGIVHRDLKPANIMVTADGTAKLTDFGIAKGTHVEQLTATNCTVGTAAYMSPEQCRGERDLTVKSDLYSLGVLFYELLTGRPPFQAESILDMFMAHVEGKFERPSRLVLDIPIWLDTLICQMLEKDPDKRPLNAAMVAQALNTVLEKVQAQRSAGVDLVSTRVIDRPRGRAKHDATDREAARVLKEAVTKRKVRRKTRPFYQGVAFQVVAISALLGAIGGIVYWGTRPSDPEVLYKRFQKLSASANSDDWDKARDGPVKEFLRHYPDRGDEHAQELVAWARDYDVAYRERQLRNRNKRNITPEGETDGHAQRALRHEEAGELADARADWQPLVKYKDSPEPEQRVWGWLAERKLAELAAVAKKDRELEGRVQKARQNRGEGNPETAGDFAVRAKRYELFGDFFMARQLWEQLDQGVQPEGGRNSPGESERRVWFLLVAKKRKDLKDRASALATTKARVELVGKKLDGASREPENARQTQALCEDVIALYKDDADFAEQVKKARELLKRVSSDGNT